MSCQQEHRKRALRVLLQFFCIYYSVVARANGTKCAGDKGMSWRSMKVLRPPAQSETVEQLTNFVILQGVFCDELSSGVIRSCPCFPMSNVVAMLYRQTFSVLLSCGEPQTCARSSFKRSTILPCGTLSFFKTGKVRMPDHYVSVFPFHIVNITLWRLESRRVPHHKDPCDGVQNLILRDDADVSHSKNALNLQVCGTAWRENFLSSTSRIQIIWESIPPYPEISGFCLTYQPVAAGYANMEDNTDIKEQGANSMVVRDNGNLLVAAVFPSFFIKFSRGLSSTYILSYTQGVLEVPNFRIQHFSCFVENAETKMDSGGPSMAVYDWPIFPFGSGLNMEWSLKSKTSCSDRASADEFNSTTGDLSIIIFVPQYSHVIFNVTHSQNPLPCPEQFCNLSVHTVPNNGSIKFALSSKTRSPHVQQRMVLSVKKGSTGYIFLSNFTVGFEGFTHYPCLFGGIFIYEFTNESTEVPVDTKSVSLLAKICSPWMAEIWNRGIEYSRAILGLHFNVRPLLFVIKTYDHLSSSYLEGRALLSNCAGVVNFLFNPTPREYNIPNRGFLIMPQDVEYNRLPRVRHQQGCLIIQNLLRDAEYNEAVNTWALTMNVTSIIKTQLPEHTIGSSSNKYFAPFIKYFYGSRWRCSLHAYPVGVDLGTFRPPRIGYEVSFSYECLIRGDRPFVIMAYNGDEISTECLSSERTERLLLADEEQSIYYVPITTCATLHIKGSMYLDASSSEVLLIFNKPNTMSICCMLHVNINVKLGYLNNIIQFKMRENYEEDIGEGWWKVWKLKQILAEETFPEGVLDVQLLGEGWKMSSLFGDVFLIVEFARPVSTFGPTTNILNILFRYAFWKGYMVTMGKTELSPDVNHYCTEGGRDCYVLLNRDKMSWQSAKLTCEKLGLALLSAPSDFEWKRFEALIVHHKILHGSEAVALAFLNLRYRQASFFLF